MMDETDQERIVDLEIQVTHQATTIEDLSQMVARQWDEIDKLSRQIRQLYNTITELQESGGPPANQKPPHY